MSNFFYQIHLALKRYQWSALLVFMLVLGGFGYAVSTLQFEEDISALLPKDAQNKELQEILKTAKFNDKVIVILKNNSSATETLVDATKRLIEQLERDTVYIKSIQGQITAETITEAQDFIYKNLPIYLLESDYDFLGQQLKLEAITERLIQLKKDLRSPMGAIRSRGYRKDPFKLRQKGLQVFKDLQLENNLSLNDGVLMTKDNSTSVLFIDLKVSSQDGSQSEAVVNFLNSRRQQLKSNPKYNAISISMIGGVFYNVSNAKQIKADIQTTLTIAVSLLLLILIVFFRSLKVPVLLFLPTICAAVIALAILAVWKQQVSAIALGVGSIILGITLDFALHTLTHLRNSNTVKQVYQAITKPIILSSFTTAIAFLCLIFVGSDALESLGVFAAISVVLSSVFALLLIPLFFSAEKTKTQKSTVLDKASKINLHKRPILVAVIALTCIVGAFFINKVQFETDLNKINFQTEELKSAEALLNETTKFDDYTTLYAVSFAEDTNEALKRNSMTASTLRMLRDDKGFDLSYASIGNIVLDEKLQRQRIARWETFWTLERRDNHKRQLDSIALERGFSKNVFSPWFQQLDTSFKEISFDAYSKLSSVSFDNFISVGNTYTTVTTPINIKNSEVSDFNAHFEDKDNVYIINRESLNESLLGQLKNTFNTLLWFSVIAVFLVMLAFFRSFWLSILTLLPIVLSWLLTLGVMAVLNLQFNVFNIIICSFIFGLGVDFAIFMTNGIIFENKSQKDVLHTYKTSILLSVLTTLLGMGALIFAKHPALQSVAAVSIIGVCAALVVSFTVHPFLLQKYLTYKAKRNA